MSPDPDNEPGGILTLYSGDVINCTADGNPEPKFHWESDSFDYVTGDQLYITEEMADGTQKKFTCFAENDINSIKYSASQDVTFVAGKI